MIPLDFVHQMQVWLGAKKAYGVVRVVDIMNDTAAPLLPSNEWDRRRFENDSFANRAFERSLSGYRARHGTGEEGKRKGTLTFLRTRLLFN